MNFLLNYEKPSCLIFARQPLQKRLGKNYFKTLLDWSVNSFLSVNPSVCTWHTYTRTIHFPVESKQHNINKPYVVVLDVLGPQDRVRGALSPCSLFSPLFLLASHSTLSVADSGDPLELCANWKFERCLWLALSKQLYLLLLNLLTRKKCWHLEFMMCSHCLACVAH